MANSEAVSDYVVRIRRELHLVPELMWTESKTSAVVKRELTNMGVTFEEVSSPGVVATIGTGARPVVGLRADMDALPLTEESDIPPERRSRIPGKMHACGHDGHTAMLGARRLVAWAWEAEGTLEARCDWCFSPRRRAARREEDARSRSGAMTPPIESAALHNWPDPRRPAGPAPRGHHQRKRFLQITLTGAGHAAVPHKNIDVGVRFGDDGVADDRLSAHRLQVRGVIHHGVQRKRGSNGWETPRVLATSSVGQGYLQWLHGRRTD